MLRTIWLALPSLLLAAAGVTLLRSAPNRVESASLVPSLNSAEPATDVTYASTHELRAAEPTSATLPAPAHRKLSLAELVALAETEPAQAVQLAAALTEADGRLEALHECLPLWLSAAPEAARSWLLAHAATLPAETAQALARDAAAVDPALGFAVAQQIYVSTRGPAMREVFGAWAARDPQAATQAVERLSKVDGYLIAVEEIGRIWSQDDAARAYTWGAQLATPDARRAALTTVIDTWAQRDAPAAAHALEGLAAEPWRLRLVDSVVGHWSNTDADAALAWAQGLRDSREREAASTTLLTQLLAARPEFAAQAALRVGGTAPNPILDKVLTAWLARDAQAADSWLRAHPAARPIP